MITDVATRRARLETLLQRVQSNRVRLGRPAAARPAALLEDEEPQTNELPGAAPFAEAPARTIDVPPLAEPGASAEAAAPLVWEGEDEDIEMEFVGEASSEEELLGTTGPLAAAPPAPPPLPSTTVAPTAAEPAAPPVEALPASIRIESPPPLDVSPIAMVGAVAPAAPPSIGALLRASIKPPGTS